MKGLCTAIILMIATAVHGQTTEQNILSIAKHYSKWDYVLTLNPYTKEDSIALSQIAKDPTFDTRHGKGNYEFDTPYGKYYLVVGDRKSEAGVFTNNHMVISGQLRPIGTLIDRKEAEKLSKQLLKMTKKRF